MGSDSRVIESVLAIVQAGKIDTLTIDDLSPDDLSSISWSGNALHIRSVETELHRVSTGEVEYLALRAPGGEPVAKGEIDYVEYRDAGKLSALATHPHLQGLGLWTRLIAAAEGRIVRRGMHRAILSVGVENRRARALYERLGYAFWQRGNESWEVRDEHDKTHRFEAEVDVLCKDLLARRHYYS